MSATSRRRDAVARKKLRAATPMWRVMQACGCCEREMWWSTEDRLKAAIASDQTVIIDDAGVRHVDTDLVNFYTQVTFP